MEERTLLVIALSIAVIGLAALFVLPDLPPSTVAAHIEWTNGTDARASTGTLYITFAQPTSVKRGDCVVLEGTLDGQDLLNARLSPAGPQGSRSCS